MHKNSFIKILISIMVILCIFMIINYTYKFYNNIFRLSYNEINNIISKKASLCNKISNCKLLPGDILIRRYVTDRTWLIDKLAHPYFTHTAFYLGDNEIIEVIGREKNSNNDIQITQLSTSDWIIGDIDNWVVIRSKEMPINFSKIKNNLLNIAKDQKYIFGLAQKGNTKLTCADLVFNQLYENDIINISNIPKIITPDYLFRILSQNKTYFNFVGYNILDELIKF